MVTQSGTGGSAIYNLASIAAEQQKLAIPGSNQSKHTPQIVPGRVTVHEQIDQQNQNVGAKNAQFVIKQESSHAVKQEPQNTKQNINIKPEIKIVSQPQILSQHSLANTTIKNSNPATASVITINKQPTPQTVTVVKPSTVTSVPHTQIQIINMNAARPTGISAPPKTLAPRVVNNPIRIAAAPPHLLNAPRAPTGLPVSL